MVRGSQTVIDVEQNKRVSRKLLEDYDDKIFIMLFAPTTLMVKIRHVILLVIIVGFPLFSITVIK